MLSINLSVFFFMFLLLFAGLFNFYAGQLTPFAQNLLTVGMVAWIAWILLGPILSTANLRVTMASALITPIGEIEDMQLIAERSENKTTVYHLVKFSGECKLCGGRVTVGRGGLAAPGRLVGRCQGSPREHLYTFDHVTRVGMPLRTSTIGRERLR